jgi:bifunctional DNase/RNase
MELVGVRVEVPANTPMVLLQEQAGERRLLPIMIGSAEASAIHYALEGVEPPRPLTHDLLVIVLESLGASLERVVVSALREHTFYAELHLITASGTKVISCRPSDAIALAVRVEAPLFADESVLDEAGQPASVEAEDEAEEIIDEFVDFLDSVNPDDFGT